MHHLPEIITQLCASKPIRGEICFFFLSREKGILNITIQIKACKPSDKVKDGLLQGRVYRLALCPLALSCSAWVNCLRQGDEPCAHPAGALPLSCTSISLGIYYEKNSYRRCPLLIVIMLIVVLFTPPQLKTNWIPDSFEFINKATSYL